jgi:pimeloyl-ACP methyl ester carboxylesterase
MVRVSCNLQPTNREDIMASITGTGSTTLRLAWFATRAGAAISPRLAGAPAARLWFTPWRVPLSERAAQRERSWLEGVEPLTVRYARCDLRGFTAGEGPTVLLVHGWGERAAAMGAFVRPLVEAGHRVVGVDLPAHGASPGTQTDAYEIADALRATAEQAGGVGGVVAHSMGAHATTVALSRGLGARAAVLLSPAVRLEHGLGKFAQMFQLSDNAIEGLRSTIERRYGTSVWRDLAADRLAEGISCDALIVHDEEDPQVDLADARMLAAAWPNASLTTTRGLGHNKVVRDPAVVASAVELITGAIHEAAPSTRANPTTAGSLPA